MPQITWKEKLCLALYNENAIGAVHLNSSSFSNPDIWTTFYYKATDTWTETDMNNIIDDLVVEHVLKPAFDNPAKINKLINILELDDFEIPNLKRNVFLQHQSCGFNLFGLLECLVFSILFNWQELYKIMCQRINARCEKEWAKGHDGNILVFSDIEFKDLTKYLLLKISQFSNFESVYIDIIQPHEVDSKVFNN